MQGADVDATDIDGIRLYIAQNLIGLESMMATY
jgi:hypothetical protein